MILDPIYPYKETNKEIIITSSMVGALLYLLLIIYQPFGTSQFEHGYKYLLLFPYAIICALSFCCIKILFSKNKKKWTIGSELLNTFLTLLLISVLSYFYNSLFLSEVNLSLENYLYMFTYTIALGLPVLTIYIMARYIYLIQNSESSVVKFKTNNRVTIEAENIVKTKFNIVSDYANFHLEIAQDDFIYAEAADNYCILYYYEKGILKKEMIRISLIKLLNQIQSDPSDCIKRVHRSFIVNLKMAKKYKGNSAGYKITLANIEKELPVSRKYIESAAPILKNFATRT